MNYHPIIDRLKRIAELLPTAIGGGFVPSGTKQISITQNGTTTENVFSYANAEISVNVPTGIVPTGTKQISITQNGTTTEDVTQYASAEITVNVPSSGYVPFTLSVASNYEGQSPYDAFMLLVNAVVATIGDKPFFAWLTTGNHAYEISYVYYIPQSITQQKDSGLGWFGMVNRAENQNNTGQYFNSLLGGFDPINTTASVSKMPTSGRSARIYTTDVYTVIDLSGVISIT